MRRGIADDRAGRWQAIVVGSGGHHPHLQRVELSGIPVPKIPKFLSSAPALVILSLGGIIGTRHISPGEVATCMSIPRTLSHFFPIPQIFPRTIKPMSPTDTRRPSKPRHILFQRFQRIFGGPDTPSRCPFTQRLYLLFLADPRPDPEQG